MVFVTHLLLQAPITLLRSITMFCGTDIILHNISHIWYEWWNILHNIVGPT